MKASTQCLIYLIHQKNKVTQLKLFVPNWNYLTFLVIHQMSLRLSLNINNQRFIPEHEKMSKEME